MRKIFAGLLSLFGVGSAAAQSPSTPPDEVTSGFRSMVHRERPPADRGLDRRRVLLRRRRDGGLDDSRAGRFHRPRPDRRLLPVRLARIAHGASTAGRRARRLNPSERRPRFRGCDAHRTRGCVGVAAAHARPGSTTASRAPGRADFMPARKRNLVGRRQRVAAQEDGSAGVGAGSCACHSALFAGRFQAV